MPGFYLDLRDREQVLDFILGALEYLEASHSVRKNADHLLDDIEQHERVSMEELATLARKVARAAFPRREAVERYIETPDGREHEWRKVVAAVSNSTGHLLERFRERTLAVSLEDVLKHEDSDIAFSEKERVEIQEVRRHILPVMYRERRTELQIYEQEAERNLEAIEERIKILRDLAFETPTVEREIIGKIEAWEDRLYYEGEVLNTDSLDQEITYYKEAHALPPSLP